MFSGDNMNIVSKDCNIPYVCVKPGSLNDKFEYLGDGSEGIVYKYDDYTAIKMFNPKRFPNKLNKVMELYNLKDDNFCFPKGVVFTKRDDLVGIKLDLINKSKEYESFLELFLNHIPNGTVDIETVYKILFKIDSAIRRIHKLEYRIGDLRPKNIMLNENNEPIFIDTDGGSYKDYGYDINSPRSHWANRVYKKVFSKEDSDKYVWALIFLESLLTYNNFNKKCIPFLAIELYQNKDILDDFISDLSIPKWMKNDLKVIFSDSDDKPYIGDIFENYNCEEPIMSDLSSRIFSLKYYKK